MLSVQSHLFTAGAFVAQPTGRVPPRDLESAVTAMNNACFAPGMSFDAAQCAITAGDVGRLRMQNVCAGHAPATPMPSSDAILAAVAAPAAARSSANAAMLQALAVIGSTPSLAAMQLPCGP